MNLDQSLQAIELAAIHLASTAIFVAFVVVFVCYEISAIVRFFSKHQSKRGRPRSEKAQPRMAGVPRRAPR
jgi:hypothetical protein